MQSTTVTTPHKSSFFISTKPESAGEGDGDVSNATFPNPSL